MATNAKNVTKAPTEQSFFELDATHEVMNGARDTIGRRTRKLVAAIIGLLLIVATIVGYGVSIVTRQTNSLESEYHELVSANRKVLVSAIAIDLAIRSFLLSGDRSYISDLEIARPELVESIARLKRIAAKVDDQGLLQLVGNSASVVSIWLSTFVDRTTIVASADTPRGDQLAGAELINNLRGTSLSIGTYIDGVDARAVEVAKRLRQRTIVVSVLVLVIAFAVIAALLIMSASDISYPLINLSHVVNRIYRGESSARADENDGPAEIRIVARAVDKLAYQQETAHKWVQQFNLAKTNFLNTIDHEMLTPLTSITGYSEILGDGDIHLDVDRIRMAKVINRNAFRLNDLIGNMLTVLRIDSLEVQFKMSTFDLRNVVRESVESFRAVADASEMSIVTDLGEMPLMVRADANEILRVVGNLVSNAVKFSFPGGRIEVIAGPITSEGGKREVALLVKDSGIGIIEAELPHIGSRFYRSSNVISAAIQGTGLGLMIVDFILHEHGGSWSLTSSELSGTTVEVRLPLTGEAISLDMTSGGSVPRTN